MAIVDKKVRDCKYNPAHVVGVGSFCDKGCEYREARVAERKACEKATGLKFGKLFYVYKGVRLKADGYEVPYVRLNGATWEEHDLETLQEAISQALKWCKEGYCPGSC